MKLTENNIVSVSTITPVYAGEKYLEELVLELATLRKKWIEQSVPMRLTEAVFVNDDAVDDSLKVLNRLAEEYEWIKLISLSRNYGQHAATAAGICHTSTDWVVTLDEDLQHRPSQIEALFRCQVRNKSDIVYAKPASAAHGNTWRDKSSKLVKGWLARLTSTPQISDFNSFRLIRGSIARAAASSSSSSTYLDIAISWFTRSYATEEIIMKDDRFVEENVSGYSLLKLVGHARKLIVNTGIDIASIGLLIGAASIMLASIIAFVSIIQKVFFPSMIGSLGWASIISTITFFSGVVIALLCIVLEYISILALNNLGRPVFFTIDRSRDVLFEDWFIDSSEL